MKRMSFAMTVDAIVDRSKTVTRRPSHTWTRVKPGDRIVAVDKVMGFKKGQVARVLGVVRVVSVRVERLDAFSPEDCAREGLPDLTPADFIARFAAAYNLSADEAKWTEVRRIEFEYLTGGALIAALGEVNQRAAAGRKARERRIEREREVSRRAAERTEFTTC
jgi:hypothetical protein